MLPKLNRPPPPADGAGAGWPKAEGAAGWTVVPNAPNVGAAGLEAVVVEKKDEGADPVPNAPVVVG